MISRLRGLLSGDGLGARAGRSSLLSIVNFGAQNVLRLASNLILTRLLFPEAFGLMALMSVVTTGLKMFSDIGIKPALIQHERGTDPDFINTAWTLQVIRGVVLCLVIVLISPLVANFYDEPQLLLLLPAMGLGAIIDGLMPTKIILANRALQLGRATVIGLINQVVIITLTALFAWLLQSVWALVLGILLGGIQRNISIRIFMPGQSNRLHWDRPAMRELMSFGKFIFLGTLAGFLISQGDRAVLGKFITLETLGIYTVAATLATMPLTLMKSLVWQIMFPLYSRRPPRESDANRRNIFRARLLLTGAMIAASAVIIVLGGPLVEFLYDARYHDAGLLSVLIALGLLPSIIMASYDSILLADKRSDLHALSNVCQAILRLGVLFVAISQYGVIGAALAPIVSTVLSYPLVLWMIRGYRAWDPVHDIVFAAISLALVGVGWWIYGGALLTTPHFG